MALDVDIRGAMAAASLVLTLGVPLAYVVRKDRTLPLRGPAGFLCLGASVLALFAVGWWAAWRSGFAPTDLRLAVAGSVPLGQFAVLLLALLVFNTSMGRLPMHLSFMSGSQETADVVLHGLVLFGLTVGALFITATYIKP